MRIASQADARNTTRTHEQNKRYYARIGSYFLRRHGHGGNGLLTLLR